MKKKKKKKTIWVSDQGVQPHEKAKSLKFQVKKEGIILSMKRKQCADQLCTYCRADLHMCFCMQIVGFLMQRLKNFIFSFLLLFHFCDNDIEKHLSQLANVNFTRIGH